MFQQNKHTVILEGCGCNTLSSRGENKQICKQEEGSEEQLRSRNGSEYDDLVVLSERVGRELLDIE